MPTNLPWVTGIRLLQKIDSILSIYCSGVAFTTARHPKTRQIANDSAISRPLTGSASL